MVTAQAPQGVLNVYATPDALKGRLSIVDSAHDETLWHLLNVASRTVEGICGRVFYTRREVRTFGVRHSYTLFVDDLISAYEVREDCDGDGEYERVLPSDEYALYPLEARPNTPSGRPYFALKKIIRSGAGGFPLGIQSVEVEGEWGFRKVSLFVDTYVDNNGGSVTKASRSLSLDDTRHMKAGETVVIRGEQLFVKQVGASVLNVVRGVNETEAKELLDGDEVLRIMYPAEVVESTLLLAVDRWRRRDGVARSDDVAAGASREIYDPAFDVRQLLKPYIR